jgi:hypothetical protein
MRAIAAIAVISALLATSAFASDFRVLDFGSPCAEAVELEEALGAEPIPSQSGPNQQTFRGRVFDHEATILYLCPDGGFALGHYAFVLQTFDKAFATFHDIYEVLNGMYGAPYIDNSRWQYDAASQDSRRVAPDPAKYMVGWRDQRVSLSMHMAPTGTGTEWRVEVVFGRRKIY